MIWIQISKILDSKDLEPNLETHLRSIDVDPNYQNLVLGSRSMVRENKQETERERERRERERERERHCY